MPTPCTTCDGTGRVLAGQPPWELFLTDHPCPACHGTRTLTIPRFHGYRFCWHGLDPCRRSDCLQCHGTGLIPILEEPPRCPPN
jgi:DnaJ-class molecular chaperone